MAKLSDLVTAQIDISQEQLDKLESINVTDVIEGNNVIIENLANDVKRIGLSGNVWTDGTPSSVILNKLEDSVSETELTNDIVLKLDSISSITNQLNLLDSVAIKSNQSGTINGELTVTGTLSAGSFDAGSLTGEVPLSTIPDDIPASKLEDHTLTTVNFPQVGDFEYNPLAVYIGGMAPVYSFNEDDFFVMQMSSIPTTYTIDLASNVMRNDSNQTISGDLTVTGNLNVSGDTVQVDSQLTTTDRILNMNDGETGAGVTNDFSGIVIDRGTEVNYEFGYNEATKDFELGKEGDRQSVATRETNPTDNGYAQWDSTDRMFKAVLPSSSVDSSSTTTLANSAAVKAVNDQVQTKLESSTTLSNGTGITITGTLGEGSEISFNTTWGDNRYLGSVDASRLPNDVAFIGSGSGQVRTNASLELNYYDKTEVDNIVSGLEAGSYFFGDADTTLELTEGNAVRWLTPPDENLQIFTQPAGDDIDIFITLNNEINIDAIESNNFLIKDTGGDPRLEVSSEITAWKRLNIVNGLFVNGVIVDEPRISNTGISFDDDDGVLGNQPIISVEGGSNILFGVTRTQGVYSKHGFWVGSYEGSDGSRIGGSEVHHDGNSDRFDDSGDYSDLRARATTANDVGLGNVANVNTTNAENISSGRFSVDRLPLTITDVVLDRISFSGGIDVVEISSTPATYEIFLEEPFDPESYYSKTESDDRYYTQAEVDQIISGITGDPVATIKPYAANPTNAPEGYLYCRGQAVSRSTYSDLFDAIGTTYGAGNGSTTFNVPDLRGEFLRGFDAGRDVDSGRVFGSFQDHQIEKHIHYTGVQTNRDGGINNSYTRAGYINGNPLSANQRAGSTSSISDPGNGVTSEPVTTGQAVQAANPVSGPNSAANTGEETRPRNIAINYIIKT